MLLTIVMVVGMLPAGVFAEVPDGITIDDGYPSIYINGVDAEMEPWVPYDGIIKPDDTVSCNATKEYMYEWYVSDNYFDDSTVLETATSSVYTVNAADFEGDYGVLTLRAYTAEDEEYDGYYYMFPYAADPEAVRPIYVGGKGVADGNYLSVSGEISESQPEGGYAHYKNGILTLSNYTYEGEGYILYRDEYDESLSAAMIYAENDLEIVLGRQEWPENHR